MRRSRVCCAGCVEHQSSVKMVYNRFSLITLEKEKEFRQDPRHFYCGPRCEEETVAMP